MLKRKEKKKKKKHNQFPTLGTYPEMEYFRSDDVQDKMRRVLYIWSCENSDVSYRQGMHELLAPLLYVLDREYLDLSAVGDAAGEDVAGAASAAAGADGGADAAKAGDNGDDGEGATPAPAAVSASDAAAASASDAASRSVFPAAAVLDAFDRRFLVHDLYTIFERVMRQMKPFFAPGNPGTGGAGASGEVGGIVRKCHKLHHVVLRKYDPELYNYLERHEIEPQLYSLRWVRLLLSREFHLEDVLVLWDAVFAESSDFGLVDYIIVAMLVYIREDVLGRDYSSCLRRLFKYPPVDNVAIFVAEALQMRNPDTKAGNVSFSTQGGVKLSVREGFLGGRGFYFFFFF
jgi:TBC1 domain family protein 5